MFIRETFLLSVFSFLNVIHLILDVTHYSLYRFTPQTTEHRDFIERWQIERGILEGEGAASVDLLEEFICSGDYNSSTYL